MDLISVLYIKNISEIFNNYLLNFELLREESAVFIFGMQNLMNIKENRRKMKKNLLELLRNYHN